MKTIFKYNLTDDFTSLELPLGFKVLNVANQVNDICIWIEVESEAETELAVFNVYGTGWDIPINIEQEYIGTACLINGMVFHVYQVIQKE